MKDFVSEILENEERSWAAVQWLKNYGENILETMSSVVAFKREETLPRAAQVLRYVFEAIKEAEVPVKMMDPGHGPGHLMRDCVNAYSLFSKLDADPKDVFIGFLGGALHDIGCALRDRYADPKHAVRHAELSALLLDKIFKNTDGCGLNRTEQRILCYVVAAHTHYTKTTNLICSTCGCTRIIDPYADATNESVPVLPVWFARWVDRLDCVGPGFVGRHYLTLAKTHQDYSGDKGFVEIDFARHMQPLFDEEVDGTHTMLGHLRMFAKSQSNESVYGKHDFGRMVELRDRHKKWQEAVIEAVRMVPEEGQENLEIIDALRWHSFLVQRIEPTDKGKAAAADLNEQFLKLPVETQRKWINGFCEAMEQYEEWRQIAISEIAGSPIQDLVIPGIDKPLIEAI